MPFPVIEKTPKQSFFQPVREKISERDGNEDGCAAHGHAEFHQLRWRF